MTLFGDVSGDVVVGIGVNVGLAADEGVLLVDCVPLAGIVAVPLPAIVVACTGCCKIVQTKRLEESIINIPSVANNGISLLFAKTCCRSTSGCEISGGFCSAGLLTCCVNTCVNSQSFKCALYPFKPSVLYSIARSLLTQVQLLQRPPGAMQSVTMLRREYPVEAA